MSKEENRMDAEQLRSCTHKLIDGIPTKTLLGAKSLRMIYGFVRAAYTENNREHGEGATE